MKKKLKQDIFNRALEQNSWVTLIAYPSLLFSYQNLTIKRGDEKNTKLISAISSHMNGYRCSKICSYPWPKDHAHHRYCKKNCEKIEQFIRRSLMRQLVIVLQRKVVAGQQVLDIH